MCVLVSGVRVCFGDGTIVVVITVVMLHEHLAWCGVSPQQSDWFWWGGWVRVGVGVVCVR